MATTMCKEDLYKVWDELEEPLSGVKMSEERVKKIIVQLVLALKYLHKDRKDGPFIHRDIKLDNIFLDH